MDTTTANSDILKDPNLFDLIDAELGKQMKNENNTRRALFLSNCSIFADTKPINTLVNSVSSAGKSFVAKKVLQIFPKTMWEYRTKISPEVFTYWKREDPNWTWDGKICYLEDVSEALLNSQPFKVMCSEGSTATIVKDGKAIDILIQGKPAVIITTANKMPNFEVGNRFNFIQLNESSKQTKDVMDFEATGKAHPEAGKDYDPEIITALKCLDRVKVAIPYAEELPQYFPKDVVRSRRDFGRFLSLIEASAALHQQQRNKEGEFYLADSQDYKLAKEAMSVIASEGLMGLNHKQKKTLEACKKLGFNGLVEKRFTMKDLITNFSSIASYKMMYTYVDELTQTGFLNVTWENFPNSNKPVQTYGLNATSENLKLPEDLSFFLNKKGGIDV